jgi:hypothetical protein
MQDKFLIESDKILILQNSFNLISLMSYKRKIKNCYFNKIINLVTYLLI